MGRLTYEKENGEWGLNGYDIKKVPKGLYGAVCKLHAYEKSGLSPDEVVKVNDFSENRAALYLAKYQEYKRLGLTPEQLMEVDKMYAEKCREVAELKKQIENWRNGGKRKWDIMPDSKTENEVKRQSRKH